MPEPFEEFMDFLAGLLDLLLIVFKIVVALALVTAAVAGGIILALRITGTS